MLNTINESDSETPLSSPFPQGNSISNPTYHHLPPSIREEETNFDTMENTNEMIKTADNYINMSENRKKLKENGAYSTNSKPLVDVNNKKQEVHYVNEDTRDWEKV